MFLNAASLGSNDKVSLPKGFAEVNKKGKQNRPSYITLMIQHIVHAKVIDSNLNKKSIKFTD
jgi:hypothetical protein